MVSFAFNIGNIDQLTAKGTRTREEITKRMICYNEAGWKVLAGLTKRRIAEKELFLTKVAPVATNICHYTGRRGDSGSTAVA